MSRYIDAEELCDCLSDNFSGIPLVNLNDILEIIEEIPTADVVEVKHGKWVLQDDYFYYNYARCTNCNEEFALTGEWSFKDYMNFIYRCPNCGARMDGGENNGDR